MKINIFVLNYRLEGVSKKKRRKNVQSLYVEPEVSVPAITLEHFLCLLFHLDSLANNSSIHRDYILNTRTVMSTCI